MTKLPKITGLLFLCNILREKWVMKSIFCMQVSMKVSYKLILWFLMGMIKQNGSQNNKFTMYLQYLKKYGVKRDEVDFFWSWVSYKLISILWASNFPTRWYYRHWRAWSSILKVLKVSSLQYLYNILKKKLGMEFIICMQINIQRFYKLALSFLMEVARHVQSTQNKKLIIFLQYTKKKSVAVAFLF